MLGKESEAMKEREVARITEADLDALRKRIGVKIENNRHLVHIRQRAKNQDDVTQCMPPQWLKYLPKR